MKKKKRIYLTIVIVVILAIMSGVTYWFREKTL